MGKWFTLLMVMVISSSLVTTGCSDNDCDEDGAIAGTATVEGVVESVGDDGFQLAAAVKDVTVELVDSDGVVVATTTTDVHGRFVFENVAAGDYRIRLKSGDMTGETAIKVDDGEKVVMTVAMNDDSELTAVVSSTKSDGTTETVKVEPPEKTETETMTVYWCKDGVSKSKTVTVAEYEANPGKWRNKEKACVSPIQVVVDQKSIAAATPGKPTMIEDTWWLAQTFTCGKSGDLVKMDLEIFGDGAVKAMLLARSGPDGDVIVKIHTAPGGDLSKGTVLGQNVIPTATLNGTLDGAVSVTFNPGIAMTAGEVYGFELAIAAPASGGYTVATDATYAGGGEAFKTIDGTSFKAIGAGTDNLVFKTYMEVTN